MLAAKLLSVSHNAAKADFVALDCLRTVPTVQIRHPEGSKRVLRKERSCCCNFRKRHVFRRSLEGLPSSPVFCRLATPDRSLRLCKVVPRRRPQQTALNKSDKASTTTQCMVLGTVSATDAASQQLRLDYITTKPLRQPGRLLLVRRFPELLHAPRYMQVMT